MSLRRRAPDPETAALIQRRLDAVLRPGGAHAGAWTDDLDGLIDREDFDDLEDDDRGPAAPGPAPPVAGRWQRARHFTRGHLGVVLVVAVVALVLAAAGVARARPVPLTTPAPDPLPVAASSPVAGTATPTAAPSSGPPELAVHVLGAVHRPGVVRLPAGARVADALRAAGGLTRSAAPGELNLAQPVADGQQVLIVTRAATQRDPPATSQVRDPGAAPTAATATGGTTGPTGSTGPVNLNTATLDQLDQLPGVGPVTAQRILDWRTAHGRFSAVAELQEVDGIGPKTFARLAPEVTV